MQLKTDAKGYVKDVTTGVVLNNDSQEYAAYILQREQNRRMQSYQKDIEFLKSELHEIKMALNTVLKSNENQNVNTNS
jgi:cell shape-determining protein MreC